MLFYMTWGDVFNVGRATQWAFSDGLGVKPKADPETIGLAILILGQVARPSLWQDISRRIIDRELGEHFNHDGFYMHQVPLAYIMFLSHMRALNPGLTVSSLVSTD